MAIANLFRFQTLALVAVALVLATAAYGFAAANVVPVSSAGDGSGEVSGYTVGSVAYTLNATDPTKLDAVKFTLTPGAGGSVPTTVKVQLTSNGVWYAASVTGGVWTTDVSAVTPSVSVTSVTNLRVVAAQ